MKSLKFFSFLLTFLFLSCSQTLDFDQIDNYTTDPVFSAAITFFEIDAASFITVAGAPAVTEITEESEFKLFGNDFIKDNLVKLDFNFEIRNEFDRDFTIEISLLDENNALIYKLQDLNITANNLNFIQLEEIDIASNSNVRNFTKVVLKISLDDTTTPINAGNNGSLSFKSGATVYLETSL